MTIAKFLDGCAAIFEQPCYNDRHLARQCRDYACVALQLETDDAIRREAAPAIAQRAQFAALAKERKKRAAKAVK